MHKKRPGTSSEIRRKQNEIKEEFIKNCLELCSLGFDTKQISEKLGYSEQSVKMALTHEELEEIQKSYPPEVINQVIGYWEYSVPIEDICERMDLTKSQVLEILNLN